MSDFTPIETQEQLNAVIGERVEKARRLEAEKYADYDSIKAQLTELTNTLNQSNEQIKSKDSTIADLQKQVSAYETNSVKMRAAQQYGLDLSLAGRLSGSTEDEIMKDAETLAGLLKKQQTVIAPLKSTEDPIDKDSPYRNMLKGLKGEQ